MSVTIGRLHLSFELVGHDRLAELENEKNRARERVCRQAIALRAIEEERRRYALLLALATGRFL
ncbi:MAG: hypothetical protein ACR2JC_09100 [Chloroflexota bacterium]